MSKRTIHTVARSREFFVRLTSLITGWAVGVACLTSCVGMRAVASPPEAEIAQTLTLDYDAFDQTPGQGWRALVEAQKFLEAATLIDAYCGECPISNIQL